MTFDEFDGYGGPELYEDDAEMFERECLARDADLDREQEEDEREYAPEDWEPDVDFPF